MYPLCSLFGIYTCTLGMEVEFNTGSVVTLLLQVNLLIEMLVRPNLAV